MGINGAGSSRRKLISFCRVACLPVRILRTLIGLRLKTFPSPISPLNGRQSWARHLPFASVALKDIYYQYEDELEVGALARRSPPTPSKSLPIRTHSEDTPAHSISALYLLPCHLCLGFIIAWGSEVLLDKPLGDCVVRISACSPSFLCEHAYLLFSFPLQFPHPLHISTSCALPSSPFCSPAPIMSSLLFLLFHAPLQFFHLFISSPPSFLPIIYFPPFFPTNTNNYVSYGKGGQSVVCCCEPHFFNG